MAKATMKSGSLMAIGVITGRSQPGGDSIVDLAWGETWRKLCDGCRSSGFSDDDTVARADHAKWKCGSGKMRFARKSKLSPFSLFGEIAGIDTGYGVKIEAR